jgi:hypothetical protein
VATFFGNLMLHRLKSSNHFMAFFVQVCATALGLLIALGIDQWKTNRSQRAVVQQCQSFLARDLTANREDLARELGSLQLAAKGLQGLRKLIQARVQGPVPADSPVRKTFNPSSLSIQIATLHSASWDAAVANQAVSHMDQWRVEKVAKAFTLQKSFQEIRSLALSKMGFFFKTVPLLDPKQPDLFTPKELRELTAQMEEFIVFFASWKESAQELNNAMGEALQACQAP